MIIIPLHLQISAKTLPLVSPSVGIAFQRAESRWVQLFVRPPQTNAHAPPAVSFAKSDDYPVRGEEETREESPRRDVRARIQFLKENNVKRWPSKKMLWSENTFEKGIQKV